ncbi:hypothetical protein HF086_006468 [Spodoptera exigua]|uniref:Uncharacterized protein n=1 Tax=Spodoptera exigua TaxID=7107 RepID=A0A922N023_SPOEX|nr:hypothetical protein HF086_006468 [Spodoptera exigua]
MRSNSYVSYSPYVESQSCACLNNICCCVIELSNIYPDIPIVDKCNSDVPLRVDGSIVDKCNSDVPIRVDGSIVDKCNSDVPIRVDGSIVDKCNSDVPLRVDGSIVDKCNSDVPIRVEDPFVNKCYSDVLVIGKRNSPSPVRVNSPAIPPTRGCYFSNVDQLNTPSVVSFACADNTATTTVPLGGVMPSVLLAPSALHATTVHSPQRRPVLSIQVLGLRGMALIDTAAKCSIAGHKLYKIFMEKGLTFYTKQVNVKLADGVVHPREILVAGVDVIITVDKSVRVDFIIFPDADNNDTLLGIDFLNAAVSRSSRTIQMRQPQRLPPTRSSYAPLPPRVRSQGLSRTIQTRQSQRLPPPDASAYAPPIAGVSTSFRNARAPRATQSVHTTIKILTLAP